MSTLAALGALPGCGGEEEPPADPFEQFLALSRLLTGFDELSEDHAEVYYDAITSDEEDAAALADVYAQAGLGTGDAPDSFEALEERGVFEDARLAAVCDAVIGLWYTGVITGPEGPVVATYTDNLAWRSLEYAPAPSVCGGLVGFWAEPPAAA